MTGMFIAGCSALAAWVATDASRHTGAQIALAIRMGGVPQKNAAAVMGLSEAQLTEQLAARQPLNHFRLDQLFAAYPQVENAYHALRAERRGLCFISTAELADLTQSVRQLVGSDRRTA